MSAVVKISAGPEIEINGGVIAKQLGDNESFKFINDVIYHLAWISVGETACRAMLSICELIENNDYGEERDLTPLRNEIIKLKKSYEAKYK